MASLVIWVEIPAVDIQRAARFYGALLGKELEVTDDGVRKTFTVPQEDMPGFSLNQTKDFHPNKDGTLVYIDGGEDLSAMLSRVEPAGGKVVIPKTQMGADPSMGYYATFIDSEGNSLALYSVG